MDVLKNDKHYNRYTDMLNGWKTNVSSSNSNGPFKLIGVAVLGLGRIGVIHVENLIKDGRADIKYLVDISLDKGQYMKDLWHLKEAKVVTPDEMDNILRDDSVDAVVIGTSTESHEELTIKSLEAGKAVLCEKPLSHSYKGIKNCYELAEKKNRPLLCAFNRRYDPALASIYERIHKGELGQIHIVKTTSRDCPCPSVEYIKTSGGIFHDCAVHDIDLISWMMGEYPNEIYATGHAFDKSVRELNDFDTVAIILEFPSGAKGIIDLSRDACYGYDQRFEIYGSGGKLMVENSRPVFVSAHNSAGSTYAPIHYSFASRYLEAYRNELSEFFDAVQGKGKVKVTKEDVLQVNEVADACLQSVKSRSRVLLKK